MPPQLPLHRLTRCQSLQEITSLQSSHHVFTTTRAFADDTTPDSFRRRAPPARSDSPVIKLPRNPSSENYSRIFSMSRELVSELGAKQAAKRAEMAEAAAKIAEFGRAVDLEKQQTRKWRAGDVYAPHDLSPMEMIKWKRRNRPDKDAFDALGKNPLDEYKNFSIMSEYMTPMGRIRHSRETGLRPVNQRRIAKAIRRAVGIGIMPSVHRHPELLEMEMNRRADGWNRRNL